MIILALKIEARGDISIDDDIEAQNFAPNFMGQKAGLWGTRQRAQHGLKHFANNIGQTRTASEGHDAIRNSFKALFF